MRPVAIRGPVLLDGAMGTALLGRGLPPGIAPEAWVLERPWEVSAVHLSHVRAGARIALTCTFSLARMVPGDRNGSVHDIAHRATWLARQARPAWVAGCVGATGLARPDGSGPSDAELRDGFEAAFRALAAAGVDLLWTETHVALREARAAVAAARRTCLPVVATAHLVPAAGGLASLDGTPGVEVLEALWRDGAHAVGVNCVLPDAALSATVAGAAVRVPVPIVAKANAGLPGAPVAPEAFAAGLLDAVRAGARFVGGCCGAGPEHLRALRRWI